MLAKKDNIPIAPITKGMQSNYSHYVASPNSWSLLENFSNDELGAITTRANIFISGTDTGASLGIGTVTSSNHTRILTKVGDTLKIADTNATNLATTITSVFANTSNVARFSQVGTPCFFVSSGTTCKYWAPTLGLATSTLSFPLFVDLIQAGFSGRIWASISQPSVVDAGKLYYSNVIPTDPTLTTGGTDYLTINSSGRPLTGLIEADNVLYCFSNDGVWRVYNTQSQDNTPFTSIGAIRQEVIIKASDSIFYMHTTGIYELKSGASIKISQDIDNLFKSFNLSSRGASNEVNLSLCSAWSDMEAIYFSVDLGSQWSMLGFTDRTYVLRYNLNYKQWSVVSFKDVQITDAISISNQLSFENTLNDTTHPAFIWAKNLTGTDYKYGLFNYKSRANGTKPLNTSSQFSVYPVKGDWGNSGLVDTISSNGYISPIFCNGETQWLTFGVENMQKGISGISIASENGAGFNIMYQIDKEGAEQNDRHNAKWEHIGTLTNDYVTFFRGFQSKKFYRIKFKISGQTLGEPVKIGEIQFLSVTNYGYGVN